MKVYDDDDSEFTTVEFSPSDVRKFADSWPCFGGPTDRPIRFTFDGGGNLIDMEPISFGGREAAVMADDAAEYAGL